MPKGKGKKKGRKEVDWAADANFDKARSIIYIEHSVECNIFAIKAEEFMTWLQEAIPERMFQLVRNPSTKEPPRKGAFEISISQNARTSHHELWSGLDKGPPRRDKFPPNYEELMPEITKVLKKFYPDPAQMKLDDEMADEEPPPEEY